MIQKSKAPWLNRKQRRHPEKDAPIKANGMPWLLYGLMLQGGYIAGLVDVPVRHVPAIARPEGKSIAAKAWQGIKRLFGRK